MTWYAVVNKVTGEAVSFGTVLGEFPDYLEAIEIQGQPDRTTKWDSSTKALVQRPAEPDKVSELLADPVVSAITSKLTKGEVVALTQKLRTLNQ